MNIESISSICRSLPSVTEEIKWGNDLCFIVGGKMFCVVLLENPVRISFKVPDEEFEEISSSTGIIPAPYAARHKWVLVEDIRVMNNKKLEHYISQSYRLIRSKFSNKKEDSLGK